MPNININSVEDGAKAYVSGIVDYSHISSQIEGEELAADDARKVANGMRAVGKPHTRISISGASVTYDNAAAPTLGEQYICEKLYTSKKNPEKGLCYTGMNKSKKLPEIFCRENAAVKTVEPVALQGEIAVGSPVTLVLRFFSTNQNKGVSLDAIIVNEKPVRISTGGAMSLSGTGFTVVPATEGNVTAIREQLAAQAAAPVAQAAAPVAQAAPVAAAPVAAAPVAQAVPVAVAPVAAAVAPAVPVQSVAPSLPTLPKGYVYDATGRAVLESSVASGITLP